MSNFEFNDLIAELEDPAQRQLREDIKAAERLANDEQVPAMNVMAVLDKIEQLNAAWDYRGKELHMSGPIVLLDQDGFTVGSYACRNEKVIMGAFTIHRQEKSSLAPAEWRVVHQLQIVLESMLLSGVALPDEVIVDYTAVRD